MNAETIVQRQLDAYNAHDLEAFIANYADDVLLYRLPELEPTMRGKAAMAEFYGKERFNVPGLRADLVNRITVGDKVIDHERVFGIRDEPFEIAAAYQVEDGKITHVWFLPA